MAFTATYPHVNPTGLIERWLVLHPVVLFMALMTFDWIIVANAGGFAVRLPYAAVFLGYGLAVVVPSVIVAGLGFMTRWSPIVVSYMLYMLVLFLVLNGTEAQGMAMRQIFFFGTFLILAAWLSTAHDPRRLMRIAGAACLLTFFIGTEIIGRSLGLSWVEAITRFATQGDFDYIFYDFLREIFNAFTLDEEDFVKASQKNAVAVGLLTALLAFRAGHDGSRPDTIGVIVTIGMVFVLTIMNSRSVMMVTVMALTLVALLRVLRDWRPSIGWAILVFMGFLCFAAGLATLFYTHNAAMDALSARLAFEDDSAASRVGQYTWAMQRIETNILWGSGYAEIHGHPVHNILLGALMHAGLGAFLLVFVFYLSVVYFWLSFLYRIVTRPSWWVLPLKPEWVAVLPLITIIRVWLSGDAGHPGLAEWAAWALFFGLVHLNATTRERTAPV